MPRPPRRPALRSGRRLRTFGLTIALVALVATAACSGPTASWHQPGSPDSGSTSSGAATLTMAPVADDKSFSPADPVTASITNGTITTVSLTNATTGRVVKGDFNADHSSWTSSEELGYDKTYTFAVTATGSDGQQLQQTNKFTTVKPNNLTLPYLRANVATLLDKGTFGVGQPVVVWFDEPIKDKAAAERTLSVTTDPPGIVGGWYWMDDHEVHWRPQNYWPSGTKVHVAAMVYGKDLGGGLYGQEDRTADFTIGPKKVAVADAVTKHMKVYIDDKQVTTINGQDVTAGIPVSMGKGGFEITKEGVRVDFDTHSGVHVVMMKYEHYEMTSSSFGIIDKSDPNWYDAIIGKAIRISNDGEFVHLADWNIPQQGHVNTSHGCINVGPAFIYWFYGQFGAGDIVDVTGTPVNLPLRDGLGDWTLTWAQWQKGSALS
jgi:lipoprotein-anchoring transpeptidase ErfK/SrfK